MKTKIALGIFVTLFTLAIISIFNSSVAAAPDNSPLYVDPTPTPSWWSQQVGISIATHDGQIGETAGNTVTVPANNKVAAVIGKLEKICPGGANSHWAKSRYDNDGGGFDRALVGDNQTCGSTRWTWIFQNNQGYSQAAVEALVWAEFPTLDGVHTSSIYDLTTTATDYQAYTSAGTTGAAGYQSKLTVWYLTYEPYICKADPDERIALSTGLLAGPDEVGEVYPLENGGDYLLYTSDGPWNDGTDDRYDIAVRFQGSDETWGDWAALSSYPSGEVCDDSFLDANGAYLEFTNTAEFETGPYIQIQFRVNDTDPDFTDNTGDVAYYWLGGEGSGQGCALNWAKGSLVGTANLDSTWDSYFTQGIDGGTDEIQRGLYSLTVTGTYLDNGTETDSVRVANWPEGDSAHNNYVDYNLWTGTEYCDDDGTPGVKTYYGSARNTFYDNQYTHNWGLSWPYGIVNDSDSNFSNNSGSIQVDIHEVEYTAPPADCASRYTVGTFIESPVIYSKSTAGFLYPQATEVGLIPGQVYYLEQVGTGYSQNGTTAYDFLIKYNGALDPWKTPTEFFDCITPLDENRNGYYFTAWNSTFSIKTIAALGATHEDNEGYLKFNLHGVVDRTVPNGESCTDYFSFDKLVWRDSVAATSTAGKAIDYSVFTPGQEYAIKIVAPAYTDPSGTGKTGTIRRAAPGVGSVNYEWFGSWPGKTCYTYDENFFDIVYFTAEQYSDYEIAATTPADNSGTINYEVWEVERLISAAIGCELEDYNVDAWYIVKDGDLIAANNDGSVNPYLLANEFTVDAGVKFKIETGYPPSQTAGVPPVWDLQISDNGGASWQFLSTWVDCWVDPTPDHVSQEYRGYWTTPKTGGPFYLRAYDAGGVYLDNVHGIKIDMWIDSASQSPGDVWGPGTEAGWGAGCTAICILPSILEVWKWVDYARCRLTSWLAWCPSHAKRLTDMENMFTSIEPFRTFVDLIQLSRAVVDEVMGYSWYDETGGALGDDLGIQAPENYLLMPGDTGGGEGIPLVSGGNSVWAGGTMDFDYVQGAYIPQLYECTSLLADAMGVGMTNAICYSTNIIEQWGLDTWINLLWNFAMIGGMYRYINVQWIQKNS